MQIDYPYDMPDDEVRIRLGALGDYLHNRHGIKAVWNGSQASFSGKYLVVKIDGSLSFGNGTISFRGQDPGILWRKRAVKYLQDKLALYLDPSIPPDELPRTR